MEHETVVVVIAKATFTKEPKWTIVMAKTVHQVVSRADETLVDALKKEKRKLNLCFTGSEAKEGKTEKELVWRLNIKLLQGQMKVHAKVVVATRHRPVTMQAFALAAEFERQGATSGKDSASSDAVSKTLTAAAAAAPLPPRSQAAGTSLQPITSLLCWRKAPARFP
ncbi:unnamed protein product [Sphagnum balticum]